MRTLSHFPRGLPHLTFPPSMHEGSRFPAALPALATFWFFDSSRPRGWEVLSHCGLICTSLMISDTQRFCCGRVGHLCTFLEGRLFRAFAPFRWGLPLDGEGSYFAGKAADSSSLHRRPLTLQAAVLLCRLCPLMRRRFSPSAAQSAVVFWCGLDPRCHSREAMATPSVTTLSPCVLF